MNTTNIKKVIVIMAAALLLSIAAIIAHYVWKADKVDLYIHTSPINATVVINGKEHSNRKSGSPYVVKKQSELSITIKRDGFKERHIDYVTPEEGEAHVYVPLDPKTSDAQKIIEAEVDHREDIVNNWFSDLSEQVNQSNPFLAELPYYGTFFVISQGVSIQQESSDTDFALYVDLYEGYEEQGKEEATDFIKEKGYKPEEFEIIYTVTKYVGRYEEYDPRYME